MHRNFGIDLLRGFSILFVVVHHLALKFRLPLGPSWLGEFLSKRVINGISFNGYEAVFIFFVLSGFLITQRCFAQFASLSEIRWREFYRTRFSRIAPLLGCLLVVLCCMHALGCADYVVHKNGQTLPRALLSALSLHLNWYEGQTTWLPAAWDVLWSLSIEEVFYLLFPLVCIALPRQLLIAGLLLLALSLPWTRAALAGNEIWQEKAYLPGMSAIAFGVLTAILAQRLAGFISKASLHTRFFALMLAALGFSGVLAIFFFGKETWRLVGIAYMFVLCASAACLVLAAHSYPLKSVQGLGWLARMGRLSYEIYLSHMFIVLTVCQLYRAYFGNDMRWSFVVYLPVVVVCLYLGVLIERSISGPALRYLRA